MLCYVEFRNVMNRYFEHGLIVIKKKNTNIEIHNIMHISYMKAVKLFGEKATDASLMKEAATMLEMKVWIPAIWNDLTDIEKSFQTLNSFTFYKDKWYPDETFEKLKARSVVNGSEQEAGEGPSTTSALTVAAIAENRFVSKIDVPVAFLNAGIDRLLYLIIDKQLERIVMKALRNHSALTEL